MPTLFVLRGPDRGRTFQTHDEPAVMGRSADEIPLSDQTVSRRHARLRRQDGAWVIEDLGSANGTYVNGVRVSQPRPLRHGDQIRLGSTLLVYSGQETVKSRTAAALPRDMVNLDASGRPDASIVSSMPSNEDSVIIAAPELADAVRSLHIMYELVRLVGSVPSIGQLLERVMEIIFEQVPVDRGFILMVDEASGELLPQVVRSRIGAPGEPDKPRRITASRTIIDHVRQHREAVLCTNAMTDERFAGKKGGSIHSYGLRSVICAPISARENVLGVIHIDCSMSAHTYNDQQLRLITAIGYVTGMAVENARLLGARLRGERLAAVGETVAYLSHHIKNILQGLRSGEDVVELGLDRSQVATIRKGWQIVRHNLDKIYNLSMNMLAFSKPRQPRHEQIQINKIVQEAIELCQRAADERHVMLLPELEEPLPPIPADPDGLQQVVLNILTNAIEAAPSGTGLINVKTHYDAANQQAIISIADNGPGIPAEQVPAIFEPFHSTKGHAGTGLGLAVARKIVEEHAGRITVSSVPAEGTIFEVCLPADQARISDSSETHAPGLGP